MHNLYLICEDIGEDVIHITKLLRRKKAAGIGMEQVINLTKIADIDSTALKQKYQKLKKDVNLLEPQKSMGMGFCMSRKNG